MKPVHQMYLLRINQLIEIKGYARVVDVAAALGIKQGSVCNTIKSLDRMGLLKHEKYRGVVLTPAGTEAVNKLREQLLLTPPPRTPQRSRNRTLSPGAASETAW